MHVCVCVLRCAAISWNINWLHLSSLYLCLFSVFVSLFINLIKKLLLYNNYWSVCVHMHRLMCGLLLHKCTYTVQNVGRDNYVKVNRSILSFTTKIPSVLHIYVCSWSLFCVHLSPPVCVWDSVGSLFSVVNNVVFIKCPDARTLAHLEDEEFYLWLWAADCPSHLSNHAIFSPPPSNCGAWLLLHRKL